MKNDKEKFKNDFKKRLYCFTLKLIEFIDKLLNDNVSKKIGDQLLRSGTSVIANYIEGQAASSKKNFINFFHISLKSANETKLWLALLRDSKRVRNDQAGWFPDKVNETANIFASSLLTMKGRK
ncbi:MAG: four helix bundle protein [Phycisphaerae bacterium]|nr:four helix bundle protein [Phycisphaerae bacterium]